MACPCPYCGVEFESRAALEEHRAVALRAAEARQRAEHYRGEHFMMSLQRGGPVLPDDAPPAGPAADPGERFLSIFRRRG